MLLRTAGNVDFDAPDTTGDLSVAVIALPPFEVSPGVLADMEDDRRAALADAAESYDPEGLYKLEVERDAAADYLADNLPASTSIRLARHDIHQRVCGGWERIGGWVVSLTSADGTRSVTERGSNPLAAAELAMNAWRRIGPVDRRRVASAVVVPPNPAA